jgi:hypothetical protein
MLLVWVMEMGNASFSVGSPLEDERHVIRALHFMD